MPTGFALVAVGSHTTNSSLSSAVTLTAPAGADTLVIMAYSQAVRYRLDGGTPTANAGFQLAVNTLLEIPVKPLGVVTLIEVTSTASVQYQWCKQVRVQV